MNRRKLLKNAVLTAPALAIAPRTLASEPVLLAPDDPVAIALKYVEDASTVDPAKFLRETPAGMQQNCESCVLYQAVRADAGSCGAVPGKLVKAAGWCNAWAPRS